jgi:hypothetical protein
MFGRPIFCRLLTVIFMLRLPDAPAAQGDALIAPDPDRDAATSPD